MSCSMSRAIESHNVIRNAIRNMIHVQKNVHWCLSLVVGRTRLQFLSHSNRGANAMIRIKEMNLFRIEILGLLVQISLVHY